MDIKRNVGVYWWSAHQNFGDRLTPTLLDQYIPTIEYRWSKALETELILAGSVLDVISQTSFQGIVAGSGKLHQRTETNLRGAKVLGLRGRLTASQVKLANHQKEYVLGDPGLLASELAPAERDKYALGIVPHWTDKELFQKELQNSHKWKYAEPILIDTSKPPLEVISLIGSCSKIVASSLHGIIVADSFHIPRRTERFAKMTSPYEGGEFKFHDYSSAIELPLEFGKLQLADRDVIETKQAELFDMMMDLKGLL